MIEICTFPRADGLVVSAKGHAGMAPYGCDIVCAGVSALLFGYLAYLESISPAESSDSPHLEWREGDGVLQVATRDLGGADLRGWAVVEAGLRLIERSYPECVRLLDGLSDGRAAGRHHNYGGKK